MHYTKDNLRTWLFTEFMPRAAAAFLLSVFFSLLTHKSKYTPKYKYAVDSTHSCTSLGHFEVTNVWLAYCN